MVIRLNRVDKALDIKEIGRFRRYAALSEPISPGVLSYGTTDNGFPYIVVERMDGFSLDNVENRKLTKQELAYLTDLFSRLVSNKIVLRDFTHLNIFIGNKYEDDVMKAWLLDVKRAEQKSWWYTQRMVAKYYKKEIEKGAYAGYWTELDPDKELIKFLDNVITTGKIDPAGSGRSIRSTL